MKNYSLAPEGNGETECVVFAENYRLARLALGKYRAKVVKSYPFINAYGVLINVYSIDDIKNLACIRSVCRAKRVSVGALSLNKRILPITGARRDGRNLREKREILLEKARIAFIDTGFSPSLDFYLPKKRLAAFVDFINGEGSSYDDNGHGTAVGCLLASDGRFSAGTRTGSAPGAEVVALKAIESSGSGSVLSILDAMQWLYDNAGRYNVKTLCMSLGGKTEDGKDPLCVAAEALWKKGITVVASAGNSGQKGVTSPGSCREIITVGSVERTEEGVRRAEYSSFDPGGIKPEICAFGSKVGCLSPSGEIVVLSGTSIAAPIIAGVCHGIIEENKNLTPNEVKRILLSKADYTGGEGTGYGYIDA